MLFHNVSLATNPQVTFKNSRCPTVGIFAAVLWEIMKVQLASTKKERISFLQGSGSFTVFYRNKKNNVKTAVCYTNSLHMPEIEIVTISSNL